MFPAIPVSFLSDRDRQRLDGFPADVPLDDLGVFFTLASVQHALVKAQRCDHNRLGCALQLRVLGFAPDDLTAAPIGVAAYVAAQLDVSPDTLVLHGRRRAMGADAWDLGVINPNRLKFLAQVAQKSTPQMLQRAPAERRYPALAALMHQTLIAVTDEIVELYDRCLSQAYARACQDMPPDSCDVAWSFERPALWGAAVCRGLPTTACVGLHATHSLHDWNCQTAVAVAQAVGLENDRLPNRQAGRARPADAGRRMRV